MVGKQTRGNQPRRAAIDPTPQPRIRTSQRLRRGIAIAVASGMTVTTISAIGFANYQSTVSAFANQSPTAPAEIEQARAEDPSRSAVRPTPSFEDLVKQRAATIARADEQVEAQRYDDAVKKRSSLLKKTAASVNDEAERLRNLENFLWPTEGGVGSPWGQRLHPILRYYRLHGGADIGGRCGQPIYAAQSGTVTKAADGGYNGGSGNNVRIDHGDINGVHVETAYLHMSKVVVTDGQKVSKGDLIGNVGSTGLSTSCHLHLSLYKNGSNSDPLEYVKKPAKQGDDEAKGDENSADYELGEEDEPTGGVADELPA